MIPADRFRLTDDGHAWWVVTEGLIESWKVESPDRPCDSFRPVCNRIGPGFGKPDHRGCPDCNGTGRHTFDVEVECWNDCKRFGGRVPGWARGSGWDWVPCWCDGTFKIALRVSVIPGMILPIIRGACPAPTNSPTSTCTRPPR